MLVQSKILADEIRKFSGKILGLVYDVPEPLEQNPAIPFPHDATAEWESRETISKIAETWKSLGFEVILFPVDREFFTRWGVHVGNIDLVHSLVEGWGSVSREGWIPSLCELSGVAIIGSGPFAQNVSMKKSLSKLICQSLKISTSPFHVVRDLNELKEIPDAFFERRHFLKPDCEGSGMGISAEISLCDSRENAEKKVDHLLENYPDGVLLEEHLPGEEFTTALVGDIFLPIAQVEVPDGIYGIDHKGKDAMNEKVTFPDLEDSEKRELEKGTRMFARAIGIEDFVRIDWRRNHQGRICFLEANPLAGLSYYYSVLPKMAYAAGFAYSDLFAIVATAALGRNAGRHLWYGKSRVRQCDQSKC